MNACIDCGSHYCTPLRRNDPSGIIAYWFASLKGSQDFLSHRIGFIAHLYNWYCSQCFLRIMYNKNIAVGDWIRDGK